MCLTMLQSYFDYAANFWYFGLTKKQKDKLQTIQNKMVRFIFGMDPRFHLEIEHFAKINLLRVDDRINYLTVNMMRKIFNSSCPPYMQSFFTRCNHGYNTKLS